MKEERGWWRSDSAENYRLSPLLRIFHGVFWTILPPFFCSSSPSQLTLLLQLLYSSLGSAQTLFWSLTSILFVSFSSSFCCTLSLLTLPSSLPLFSVSSNLFSSLLSFSFHLSLQLMTSLAESFYAWLQDIFSQINALYCQITVLILMNLPQNTSGTEVINMKEYSPEKKRLRDFNLKFRGCTFKTTLKREYFSCLFIMLHE